MSYREGEYLPVSQKAIAEELSRALEKDLAELETAHQQLNTEIETTIAQLHRFSSNQPPPPTGAFRRHTVRPRVGLTMNFVRHCDAHRSGANTSKGRLECYGGSFRF